MFIPTDVARLMRAFPMFEWLPQTATDEGGPLKVWARRGSATVYWHYHFSHWGKPDKDVQLRAIRELIEAND